MRQRLIGVPAEEWTLSRVQCVRNLHWQELEGVLSGAGTTHSLPAPVSGLGGIVAQTAEQGPPPPLCVVVDPE